MNEKEKELVELTRQQVTIQSTNVGTFEYRIAEFIENWLRSETGIVPVRNEIVDGRYNVIAEYPGEQDAEAVVMICHMDTVPVGNGWSEDPFAGAVKKSESQGEAADFLQNGSDGEARKTGPKLYGRGAVDMKAGLAIGMIAFRDAIKSKETQKRTLRFIASADEEIEMRGAIAAVNSGYIAKDSLVFDMEPSSEEIIQGHKGKVWFRVHAMGRPAHGSMPWDGIPAILAMAEIVRELNARIGNMPEDAVFGKNSICFGTLTAGDNINVVADKATLEIDVRLVPPATADTAEQMMKDIFSCVQTKVPGIRLSYEVVSVKPCIPVDEEAMLVQTFQKAVEEEEGRSIRPTIFTGYTDTGVAASMTGSTNCLSYGPCGGGIHQNDEWVDCDSIYRVYKVIQNVIGRLT